jgi:hypothetical protein
MRTFGKADAERFCPRFPAKPRATTEILPHSSLSYERPLGFVTNM